MKEQAEKLDERAMELLTILTLGGPLVINRESILAVRTALAEAIEEGYRKAESEHHDEAQDACPDCANLREQGAEEKRIEVLAEAAREFSVLPPRPGDPHPLNGVYASIKAFSSLQPPKPGRGHAIT